MDNGKEMTPEQTSSDAETARESEAQQKASARKARSPATKAKAQKSDDAPSGKRRRVTTQERSRIMEDNNRRVQGGGNIKSILETVGLKPQTYYLWRRSSKGQTKNAKRDDLEGLQKENVRLKRLLAERLVKENAELKKRLGA